MSLLHRILQIFQFTPHEEEEEADRMIVSYSRPLEKEIKRLAYREGMPPDEMTVEILQAGIADRWDYHRSVKLWQKLTPKEQEVAAFICLGLSNDQIAEKLHISRGTVRTHVRHIFQKFEVENRVKVQEILRWWEFSE